MSTPRYDALVSKTRDWSNKPELNTVSDSVIKDCLSYAADECYRLLRIPPLEEVATYVVTENDNTGIPNDFKAYTSFPIPEDLTSFIFVRSIENDSSESNMFNEITDKRTFFDPLAETYSSTYWMWMGDKIFVRPQLAVGTRLEIHYYKRLPALGATYSIVPLNYIVGLPDNEQPYLEVDLGGTPLFFSIKDGVTKVFATALEAELYNTPVTTNSYSGKEVSNWLRDQNERLLIWGGLYNLGAYLLDDNMEKRYNARFIESINSLNKEEKWRRALGGNVQTNVNTNGLI